MSEPSLDDVLSGSEPEETQVEEPKGDVVAETEETPGVDASTPEKEPEPASTDVEPPSTDNKEVPVAALVDERVKRQAAESKIADLEAKLAAQAEPPKQVDPLEDPEGFKEQIRAEMNAELFQMKREAMLERYDDFEEAEAWASEQIGSNLAMRAKLEGSNNILKDAYTLWEQHKALQELENVDVLRERIREEERAKLLAGNKEDDAAAKQAATLAQKATAKPSLANIPTSKGATTEGDLTLEDVLGEDASGRR